MFQPIRLQLERLLVECKSIGNCKGLDLIEHRFGSTSEGERFDIVFTALHDLTQLWAFIICYWELFVRSFLLSGHEYLNVEARSANDIMC